MEWFGENAGGLNRVYAQLVRELARDGVELHGLVAGSPGVARASDGLVHAFAPSNAPLLTRMRALRTAVAAWLRERPDAVIVSHFALNAFPVLSHVAELPLRPPTRLAPQLRVLRGREAHGTMPQNVPKPICWGCPQMPVQRDGADRHAERRASRSP